MVSRTLSVKIVGDSASGEAAVLKFASSLEKAQKTADVSASKIYDDFRKMEAAAKDAAAANEKLANVGSSGGISGGLADLLRGAPGGNVSNAVLGKIADSLDTTAGKAALAGVAVAATGVVVAKFGTDAVQAFGSAAEEVDKFQDVAGGTAQQASLFVNAAKLLGVSTDSLDLSIGRMLKNVNANEAALNSYGATVKRTSDGSVDSAATFQSIAKAFADTTDPAKRAELASLAFGRGWQSINDILERGGQSLDEIFAKAAKGPILSDADVAKGKELNVQISSMKLAFADLEVSAGKLLVPVAEVAVAIEKWTFGQAKAGIQAIIDSLKAIASAGSHLPQALGGGAFEAVFNALDSGSKDAADGVNKLGGSADETGNSLAGMSTSMGIAAGTALGLAANTAAAASAFQAATADIRSAEATQNNYAASLDQLDQLNQKMTSSSTAVADAQASGARQIADAQKGVEQALQGVADAQVSYAKAVDDANRSIAQAEQDYTKAVDDANRKVADAEEQASKRIVDAQQKVTDARHRAAEEAVSSARRVEDATQALRDAETDSLREANPYDAQRKREDAGKALTRAQEDAAQQQQDSASTVAQAEQDLADTQQQAAEDRANAERDAADQIAQAQQRIVDAHRQAAEQIASAGKQVEDAEGRVAEASARVQQTSDDAQASIQKAADQAVTSVPSHQQLATALQGVTDNAFNAAYQMKQAGASDQDIQAFLETSKKKVDDYATSWGFTAAEVAEYNRQIGLISRTVNVQYNLSLNATDFYNKIGAAASAMHVTGDQLLADAGSLGITPILHDSGGYLPVGLSLSLNKTGRPERVLNADQEAAVMGGMTIVVQGSVISERDLAEIVAKAMRRGYKGFN